MIVAFYYDTTTGEVVGRRESVMQTSIELDTPSGCDFSVIDPELTDYDYTEVYFDINTQTIAPKTLIPYTKTDNVISNLPDCQAAIVSQYDELNPFHEQYVLGEVMDVDDGELTIDINSPGEYQILLCAPLYLDTLVSLEVT